MDPQINFPNKIYVSEYKGDNDFKGKSHFVIVVAAINSDVARKYVKEMIGFDVEPTWLMNAGYPTIYNCDGSKPCQPENQVKILSNNCFHTFKNKTFIL